MIMVTFGEWYGELSWVCRVYMKGEEYGKLCLTKEKDFMVYGSLCMEFEPDYKLMGSYEFWKDAMPEFQAQARHLVLCLEGVE